MRAKQIIKLLAYILLVLCIAMSFPLSVAYFNNETEAFIAFAKTIACTLLPSVILLPCIRKENYSLLSQKDGYIFTVLTWIIAAAIGAVPLILSKSYSSYSDAFFEVMSGLTTTGSTTLNNFESCPKSILLWRSITNWLGGMGIVMLTVALMPLLGVGGFQLIKAETTGPEKGKMTPKMAVTAKILWFIYLGMTVLETILLLIAGMPFWEALAHSFATLGTGGFSSRNASIGAFNSPAIEWICAVFMGLSGVNFSLYYMLLIGKGKSILQNSEFKAYILLLFVSTAIVTFSILPLYASFGQALRYSVFQVVSINTTTGFATADFTLWPPLAQLVIFMLFFVGGCSGSTGGGFKVVRWVILGKQAHNEMKSLLHPHGVFTIRSLPSSSTPSAPSTRYPTQSIKRKLTLKLSENDTLINLNNF